MKDHSLGAFVATWFLVAVLLSCTTIGAPVKSDASEASKKVSPTPSVSPQETAKRAEIKPPPVAKVPQKEQESVAMAKKPETSPWEAVEKEKPLSVFATLDRNAVGCILPLSGRYAEVGNKALDALILSSDIFNRRYNVPWKIVIADSGESSEGIQKAVAYLADQARVMAIVAVAGTAEAADAAREAEQRKVPLILMTSKEGVTANRDYVFQHFLTPTQQMRALARYSLDRLNVAIFSILYPQDEYGEEMARIFSEEVRKVGGKVNKVIPYDKSQTDFSEQIFKLTGQQKTKTSGRVAETPQDVGNKMFVDFEALFIPDSPLRLKMIASQLAYYDVKGIRLLGTSLWHTPDLLKKNADYLEGAIFVDSFLPNGFLPETNDFVDVFYSAYRREPDNIEALSYDSMEVVLGLLEDDKIKTRGDFKAALLGLDRFYGATGSVYFHGNHVAQKNAFILKISNGKLGQVK